MRYLPLTATLFGLSLLFVGGSAHAQFLPLIETSTSTFSSTTPRVSTSTVEATSSPFIIATSAPAGPLVPTPIVKKKTAPVPAPKKHAQPAEPVETPAPAPVVMALSSPPLITAVSGDIYRYASHPPLPTDITVRLLGIALLCGLIGFLLIERRFLERSTVRFSSLFSRPLSSSRGSLPRPQIER